jgi:hypothetical protein
VRSISPDKLLARDTTAASRVAFLQVAGPYISLDAAVAAAEPRSLTVALFGGCNHDKSPEAVADLNRGVALALG